MKKIPVKYDNEDFVALVRINSYNMVCVWTYKRNPVARFFRYSYVGYMWFWVDDFQSIIEGVQQSVKQSWDIDIREKNNQKKIEDFKNNY